MRASLCYELISSVERERERETNKRHVGEAHSVVTTAIQLPQRLSCYWGKIVSLRMLTNRRLAYLRLTTAQQRTTGQDLPSDLYNWKNSVTKKNPWPHREWKPQHSGLQQSALRMLTNLRLAELSLTTAQQRSTGQDLPSDLYNWKNSVTKKPHDLIGNGNHNIPAPRLTNSPRTPHSLCIDPFVGPKHVCSFYASCDVGPFTLRRGQQKCILVFVLRRDTRSCLQKKQVGTFQG
jgi:hypothetical protein